MDSSKQQPIAELDRVAPTMSSDNPLNDAYRVINGISNFPKKKCMETLHGEKNTFLAISARPVSEGGNGHATALLDLTERVLAFSSDNMTIMSAILLAIQAENIPPTSVGYFMCVCNSFLKSANYNDIVFVYREITTISNKLVSIGCATSPKSVLRSLMKCVVFQTTHYNSHTLTPSHANLLQAVISAQMYTYGAKLVTDTPILEVPPYHFTKSDFLRYFYYAGTCLVGVCDFDNAIDMFEQAIAVQGNVISAISVCSLKKACLISLIHNGAAFQIPKHASSQVKKLYMSGLAVYEDIVKAFIANDHAALLKCIEDGADTLKIDQNFGIAKQVADALVDHRIRKLTQTYITMPISDISKACQLGTHEVHLRLMKMISNGTINAIIDESSNTVLFRDNVLDSDAPGGSQRSSSGASDAELVSFLQAHMSESIKMSDKIREMLKSIMISEEYVKKMTSSTRGTQSGGPYWADSMDCDDGPSSE